MLFFPPKILYSFIGGVHRLGKLFFISLLVKTSVVGIVGSFYEAFFNSVHIDIRIISYRQKLRNIS